MSSRHCSVARLALAGLLGLAATAGTGCGEEPPPPAPEPVTAPAAVTLAEVAPAPEGTGPSGVTAGAEGGAMSVGVTLPVGSPIRTDARTRARLVLAQPPATIVLDHDTEIVLAPAVGRLTLARGRLVAEVERQGEAPALFVDTPSGTVEVTGTKLAISATGERTAVRVARGDARLRNDAGAVEVKTGLEAWSDAGRAPSVAPAVDLAESVAFGELERPDEGEAAALRGLGELRAHLPGESQERERPLALARHEVKIRIVGNVARTEIEEVFRNDSNDTLEGVYRFPLPPGARIASLSLLVDDTWEEGAFVDRTRGRAIWRGVIDNARRERLGEVLREVAIDTRELIWRPGPWHDPALLEWQQGGRFELRIFPIPAHGERRVRLAYEQVLAPHGDGHRYVYPLPQASDGSTRVGEMVVDARVRSAKVRPWGYEVSEGEDGDTRTLSLSATDFEPRGDLVIDFERVGQPELRYWTWRGAAVARPGGRGSREERAALELQQGLAEDDRPYALFAVRPELPGYTEGRARDYAIVVDSSQSMVGERWKRAARLAQGLAAEMDRRDRLMVLACHRRCRAGDLSSPGPEAVEKLEGFFAEEQPAGASDLVASLRDATRLARAAGAGGDRELVLLYIGDGVPTVGARAAGDVAAEVQELVSAEGVSLTTVGVGQDADEVVLRQAARAGRGHYVPYVPGQRLSGAALAILETTYGPSLEEVTVELPAGLEGLTPASLPNVRAGEELLLAARMTGAEASGDLLLRGKVGGRPFEQRYPLSLTASTAAGNTFVPRQWASLRIAELALAGRAEDRDLVVALSKGFGVMSRETSLIVLEDAAMFRAYGVDRSGPTLQWSGEEEVEEGSAEGALEVAPRPAAAAARPSARSAGGMYDDTLGALDGLSGGGLGLVGRGSGGGGGGDGGLGIGVGSIGGRMGGGFRRVRVKSAAIREGEPVRDRDREAVTEAEAALSRSPDSRDAHRALVRALSRAGELARAEAAARTWLERDQLDWEALTYLSDAVGRQGRREEAVRLLEGIVDLVPEEAKLQERLALAFARRGMAAEACAHRVAYAAVRGYRAGDTTDAVRCERALGREGAATRLLARAAASDRAAIERDAAEDARPERARGELLVEGSWETEADLDLTLVTPQGTRLSWLGGRTSVVSADAASPTGEKLALTRAASGSYVLEVTRANADDRTPVTGTLRVTALDETRRIAFELPADARSVAVGRVDVTQSWVNQAVGGAPRVSLGMPTVNGNLDRTIVRRVMQRGLNQMRFCYEQARQRRPDAAGRADLSLVVGADGGVAAVQVTRNPAPGTPLADCLAARTRTFRFPPIEGGGIARVVQPIVFGPN